MSAYRFSRRIFLTLSSQIGDDELNATNKNQSANDVWLPTDHVKAIIIPWPGSPVVSVRAIASQHQKLNSAIRTRARQSWAQV